MDAKKCDRCGEYYRETEGRHFEVNRVERTDLGTRGGILDQRGWNGFYQLDLCDACWAAFLSWWNSRTTRN